MTYNVSMGTLNPTIPCLLKYSLHELGIEASVCALRFRLRLRLKQNKKDGYRQRNMRQFLQSA